MCSGGGEIVGMAKSNQRKCRDMFCCLLFLVFCEFCTLDSILTAGFAADALGLLLNSLKVLFP